MSKERPIVFSGESVRAIIAGRKTQTRRVVTVKSDYPIIAAHEHFEPFTDSPKNDQSWTFDLQCEDRIFAKQGVRCPLGLIGDRLWVRENWAGIKTATHKGVWYQVDGKPTDPAPVGGGKWKASRYMPRWASRLMLEVVSVRVERLHEMSHHDAHCEGVIMESDDPLKQCGYKAGFKQSWDKLNKRRGFPWSSNPFVWVVEFKRL